MRVGDNVTNRIRIEGNDPGILRGKITGIGKALYCRRGSRDYEVNSYDVAWGNGEKSWHIRRDIKQIIERRTP